MSPLNKQSKNKINQKTTKNIMKMSEKSANVSKKNFERNEDWLKAFAQYYSNDERMTEAC